MEEPLEQYWRKKFKRYAEIYSVESWVSGWSPHSLARRVNTFVRAFNLNLPKEGAIILDLGCGGGTYSRLLEKKGYNVVGVDYSLESLQKAQSYPNLQRIWFINGEGYNLPLKSGSVDRVVCVGVLQTVNDEERLTKEMMRVLRPGGILLVDAINDLAVNEWMRRIFRHSTKRLRRYNPYKLAYNLKNAGAKNIQIRCVFIFPEVLTTIEKLLERVGIFTYLERLTIPFILLARAFFVIGVKK